MSGYHPHPHVETGEYDYHSADDDTDGDYDVHEVDQWGNGLLHLAFLHGSIDWVCTLLKNPDINTTLKDVHGCTPLWMAAHHGNYVGIQHFVASGRELGSLTEKGMEDEHLCDEVTPLEMAVARKHPETVKLLTRLMMDENQTRHEIRLDFKLRPQLQAHLFALVVFICEGLLVLEAEPLPLVPLMTKWGPMPTWHPTYKRRRFFQLVTRLPMELQMLICNRANGSMRDNIPTGDSEPMFKLVAKVTL